MKLENGIFKLTNSSTYNLVQPIRINVTDLSKKFYDIVDYDYSTYVPNTVQSL